MSFFLYQTKPCFKRGYHGRPRDWRRPLFPAVTSIALFVFLCISKSMFISFSLIHIFFHLLLILKKKLNKYNFNLSQRPDIILGAFTLKCFFLSCYYRSFFLVQTRPLVCFLKSSSQRRASFMNPLGQPSSITSIMSHNFKEN